MIKEFSVLAMLGVCSVEDIKKKSICIWQLLIFGIFGVLCQIILFQQPLSQILLGTLPGVCLMILSFISSGNIGSGDGMLLLTVGVFLGAAYTMSIFLYALFFSAVFAFYLYVVKKKKRNYEIPFVPFLLIGFIVGFIVT